MPEDTGVETAPPQSATGGGIKGRLTKKIGPLPTWAWGAILVGGVALFIVLRKRGDGGGGDVPLDDGPFDFGGGAGFGGGSGGGGGSDAPAPTGGGGSVGGPDDSGGDDATRPVSTRSGGTGETARNAMYAPDVARDDGVERRGSLTAAGMSRMESRYGPDGDLLSSIERQLSGGQSVSVQTGYAALNQRVATNLTQRGNTAAVINNQVYAARDPLTFFNSIPRTARENLARYLVAINAN